MKISWTRKIPEHIVVYRILHKVQEVLHRPLPRDSRLSPIPKHGDHGQPPILDLLHGLLHKRWRIAREAQRIKGSPSRVVWVPRQVDTDGLQAPDADVSGWIMQYQEVWEGCGWS